jgi:HSP20 family protein
MPVFRWGHAWQAFDDLEREVDRLLQGVGLTLQRVRIGRHYPPINLYELEDEFLLLVELPGTRPEELELTVNAGVLTMNGNRVDPHGVPEDRYRRQERFRGPWQRSVSLPERVQEDKLTAEFASGILKIHLPKLPRVEPRRIPVIGTTE